MTSPMQQRIAAGDDDVPPAASLRRLFTVAGIALASGLIFGAPSLAMAQPGNEQSNALTQQELNRINNQPIAPAAKSQLNQPREPSFELNERDGTQVREYRNKGQATDIQVRSGFGTKYEMSKPEDSSPKIRDHDVNRVPSVNLKF